jgi:hypothetical protein
MINQHLLSRPVLLSMEIIIYVYKYENGIFVKNVLQNYSSDYFYCLLFLFLFYFFNERVYRGAGFRLDFNSIS